MKIKVNYIETATCVLGDDNEFVCTHDANIASEIIEGEEWDGTSFRYRASVCQDCDTELELDDYDFDGDTDYDFRKDHGTL